MRARAYHELKPTLSDGYVEGRVDQDLDSWYFRHMSLSNVQAPKAFQTVRDWRDVLDIEDVGVRVAIPLPNTAMNPAKGLIS